MRPGLKSIAAILGALLMAPAAAAERPVVQLRWEPQFQYAGYDAAPWQSHGAEAGFDVDDGSVVKATEERRHDLPREAGFVEPLDADFALTPEQLVAASHEGMPRWLPWVAAGLLLISAGALMYAGVVRRTVRRLTGELRASDTMLRAQAALLNDAEDLAHLGHWHLDMATGAIRWSRPVFRMHGLDSDIDPPSLAAALALQHPEDRLSVLRHMNAAIRSGAAFDFSFRLLLRDGKVRYLKTKGRIERGQNGEAVTVFGVAMDITERTLADQKIEYLAYHDPLTGLPNRALFDDRLRMALAARRRTDGYVGVLMLDLDGFKQVNDTYGHQAGDQLLKVVANRLLAATRATDTVCRLGGDEFTVLLTNLIEPIDAERIAANAIAALSAPVSIGKAQIRPHASIGICIADDRMHTPPDVLSNADVALYQAKVENRGGLIRFESHMRMEKDRFAVDAGGIREGLKRGEFVLHWQPIFDAQGHAYRGSEILIRWHRPGRGLLPPDAFLPAAKACGLMDDLDAWVLETALDERAASPNPAVRAGFITVNMSGDLLTSHTMKEIAIAIIERHSDDDINLILEVTEDVAMSEQIDAAARTLHMLADRGVAIALDDFGTGHGTLSDLRRFPIHYIKIDREFVDLIDQRADSTAIVTSVVWLAHSMGITTIGEGVERPEEAKRLTELGCQMLQGYHFGNPMPREALERRLADRAGEAAGDAAAA